MRRSMCVSVLPVILVVTACAAQFGHAEDASPDRIIGLERAALDRWGKSDPSGFYEIMAAEESYFDPLTDARVDGLDALEAYIAPVYGKITVERYEMLNPRVQATGDVAVLTFNLIDHGVHVAGVDEGTPHWNSTEVFRRENGRWKIIHSHWSYVKPVRSPKL